MEIDNGTNFTGLVQRGDKAINERYRPRTFHEVIGNEATKKALAAWMERGEKRSRALLLLGGSGEGKTSIARVLAMGLNCEHGDTVNPCCECPSCKSAMVESAMHIKEYNMSALSTKDDADTIVNSMYDSSFTGRNNVFILDECLHYDTNIDCIENGKVKRIPIGHIVHKKMNVDVLSYNSVTGLIEIKPVINWFKNPKKEVYEWVFERVQESNMHPATKILTCTENHTVFLSNTNQEVQIGSLKKGDVIRGNLVSSQNDIHFSAIVEGRKSAVITEEARQFILGTLLGDCGIGVGSENSHARIYGIHCKKQEFYAIEKVRILGDIIAFHGEIENGGYAKIDGTKKMAYKFNSKSRYELDEFYDMFNRHNYNIDKILSQLDTLGVAVWYMDDGSLSSNTTVNLSTHDFSEEENDKIVEFFKSRYNIEFKKLFDKRIQKYSLYCCGENKNKFIKLVAPFILNEFQYKCGDVLVGNGLRNIKPIIFNHIQKGNYVECKYRFIEKRYNQNKNTRGHVYDIEVADNHNYFASGINVHNCQGMSSGSQNLMLKMLENPPSNTYVILATTNPEKILKTVKTRCEIYEVASPSTDDIKQLLGSVVKQEMPSMTREQRVEILNACKGLGYREILMKLDKFIKGGGTGSIEEAFQADYATMAKAVIRGDYNEVMNQIEKCGDKFEKDDIESAKRVIRGFLCNNIKYFMDKGDGEMAKRMLLAFRVFDKGFYTDPKPLSSFKADVFEACLVINGMI